jgi:adenylate cyclase
MAKEIERKFLLKNDSWRAGASGTFYCQGYISRDKDRAVRIRIIEDKSFLTVKRLISETVRMEFEYDIPVADARVMLEEICEKPLIEKKRYRISHRDFVWEIDEFFGENAGLVVAEIELTDEDQAFEKPDWIGEEVTNDFRYLNVNLVRHPYTRW